MSTLSPTDSKITTGKHEFAYIEHSLDAASPAEAPVQLKSGFDRLTVWQTFLKFKYATVVCLLGAVGGSADGYQIGLNGNIIANPGFVAKFGEPIGPGGSVILPTNVLASWGAVQSSGQMIGMVLLTPFSDRFGRKFTMYNLWFILCLSILCMSLATNWKVFLIGKLFAGIGVGTLQATIPMYICEWSPVNLRGAMVMGYSIWFSIGNFCAPVALEVMSRSRPDEYKIPIYTQWAVLGLMIAIFIFLPESPWYYAQKGNDEKGKAVLRRVNGRVRDYDVEEQYAILKNTIKEERMLTLLGNDGKELTVTQAYLQLFKGVDKWRTLASYLPTTCQQLSGLALLGIYSSYFFQNVGFTNAFLITVILTSIQIGSQLVFAAISDHFGRRSLVLSGIVICTCCVFVIGIIGVVKTTSASNIIVVVAACIWAAFNQLLGSLGWLYSAEVASSRLRAKTAGVSSALAVVWGLTFNTTVPYMLDVNGANLGLKSGFIFFGMAVVTAVLTFLYVPETARRSPAELDELFEKGVKAWRFKGYNTDVQERLLQEHNVMASSEPISP